MRKRTMLLAILGLFGSAGLGPAAMHVGLGVMAGEPTGVTIKAWSSGRHAVDGAVGWSLGSEGWLYVHADYLWHSYDFESEEFAGSLPWYFGVGGRALLKDGDDSAIGVRLPLGLNYLFERQPLDVFIEIAPIVNLAPETDFDLSGGIGIRYYF